MSAGVDTRKAAGRRSLHFDRLEDILADAETLAAGPVRTVGNWSFGQICEHLAMWMDFSIDGVPVTVPWYVRAVGRLLKPVVLKKGFQPGFRWAGENARLAVPGDTEAAAGLGHLRDAVARLRSETKRAASPLLGRLDAVGWERLHCRHAELHLSFAVPG